MIMLALYKCGHHSPDCEQIYILLTSVHDGIDRISRVFDSLDRTHLRKQREFARCFDGAIRFALRFLTPSHLCHR
jgi:hypothetical protein